MERDLSDRLFNFASDVIKMLRNIKYSQEAGIIKYQLTKSSTSSGANYEESQAASSKADFTNKISISLKEMRESNYWLRIIKASEIYKSKKLDELITESGELKNILGAIYTKARRKGKG